MRAATNLEMVAIYEAQAAEWFDAAVNEADPMAAFCIRDYAQHCQTMAEMFRLKHSDELIENGGE